MRTLHLCQFQFKDQDIRVVGTEIDGGTSINGISDVIAIDGGGYWQADFSNADFGGRDESDRADTLAWRAINAGLGGGTQAIVRFCDQWHQPVLSTSGVPHSDETPFSDDGLYVSSGAVSSVLAVNNGQTGGLNCTSLDISLASGRGLLGGERFTLVHPVWGPRAYEISGVTDIDGGKRITFIPPVRGGVAVGDAIDFDDIRCVMRRSSQPTNALSIGIFSSASITFVEDMRDPDL